MSDLFKLEKTQTATSREMLAGVTTFLAMAYILAVNPSILGAAGMPKGGVFIATALSAFFGTVLMALLSNYPFALAPGMGLNAFFTYAVVLGMGYSWQFALLAVFTEGIIFLLLSLTKVREGIFNSIPLPLKAAVSVGIGLFIAYIALQGAHIIINNEATLTGFQAFKGNTRPHNICAILTIIGTFITGYLVAKKVKGAILLGILITWCLGMIAQATGLYIVTPSAGCFSLYPSLSLKGFVQNFKEFGQIFWAVFDSSAWTLKDSPLTGFALLKSVNFVVVCFTFMFVDIFDTLGTLIGVASKADMLTPDGKLPRVKGALLSDSIATAVGAVLGTSTVTTYVESAAGVSEGGRTGLTAMTTAFLFLIAIIFAPVFLAIPSFATAPALLIVGYYMFSGVTKIDFSNPADAIPCYLCILIMPFAYSIAEGIGAGIVSWTLINFFTERRKEIHPLMYVLTVVFILKYALL